MTTDAEHPPSRTTDPVAHYEQAVARHYRWNVTAFLLYGLLGTTGWRLITAPTFVPDYVYRLGGSNAAVGVLLFCGGLARFASPLAGATHIADRPLVKRTAIWIGGGMRLQVLGMALTALLLPTRMNLPAFALCYCVFNVLSGLQGVVFGVLMAKVIPLARRGRFIGLRDFAGGATAAAVAWMAGAFLRRLPFPAGYGVTYLVAFAFTSAGLFCFASIREAPSPVVGTSRSLAATLAAVPRLLTAEPGFAWYCAARGLAALGLMAAPFFIIAAARTRAQSDPAILAQLSAAYFLASTVANLLWGQLADRAGFRSVFLSAAAVWLAALGLAAAEPPGLAGAAVLFAAVGAGQSGLQMASVNLVYELAEPAALGTRIAVSSALGELMGALAPLLGGAIADRWSYPALYAAAALSTMAGGAAIRRVPPRARR